MRAFKGLLDVGVAACLGMRLLIASGASAARPKCAVVNVRAGQRYGTLQEATDAASAGDTLTVKGTCLGETEVGKSLTVVGLGKHATLDGGNSEGSAVRACRNFLGPPSPPCGDVEGGTFEETGCFPVFNGRGQGGGISIVDGSLTLNHSTVTGNSAELGGGIFVLAASATLNDSTVTGNSAEIGGGIFDGEGVTLNNSTVTRNTAKFGGGIFGDVTLNDSTVTRNTADHGETGSTTRAISP